MSLFEAVGAKGVGFRYLAEDIVTTTLAAQLVFHIYVFASIVQFERERVSERTKEGILVARAGMLGKDLCPVRRAPIRGFSGLVPTRSGGGKPACVSLAEINGIITQIRTKLSNKRTEKL
jgi:DNA invertase Pin-like site-specific DNA recombinase